MFFAADTNVLIHYFNDVPARDTHLVDAHLLSETLYIPPIVIAELLSGQNLPEHFTTRLAKIPQLAILPQHWERAGELRRAIRAKGYKSHLADTLIAQSCIDHDATLITCDRDFRHYVELGGLKVA